VEGVGGGNLLLKICYSFDTIQQIFDSKDNRFITGQLKTGKTLHQHVIDFKTISAAELVRNNITIVS
jgi:hypothetical protein